jgi:hypothetical protein
MGTCASCGNDYDKSFEVRSGGQAEARSVGLPPLERLR